jgi:hypothetical protein
VDLVSSQAVPGRLRIVDALGHIYFQNPALSVNSPISALGTPFSEQNNFTTKWWHDN